MSTINVHFGLGSDTEIDKIIIRWPSGIVDQVDNPALNQSHLIIEGSTVVSIPEFDRDALSIFPNPAQETLYINYTEDLAGSKTTLYDLSGRVIMYSVLTTAKSIDISSLKPGMYWLQIDINGQLVNRKFIKK